MLRIPVEKLNFQSYDDEDVIKAWKWFMSFMSERAWQERRKNIEKTIYYGFRNTPPFSEPLTEGTLLVEKKDVIGWYLYLIETLIYHPHKYEYFQGARVVPIFKRLGIDLNAVINIGGIEARVKGLLRKRKSEADALLFEILTALAWVKNGYEVSFIPEQGNEKSADFVAEKGKDIWHIECKRQSKTSNYAYRETAKRQTMISYVAEMLIEKNMLLDIVFHVELESLPDTFLKDILARKLQLAIPGKIVSNEQVDISMSYVDIHSANKYIDKYVVKNPSPALNQIIGGKQIDNLEFTAGLYGDFYRVGDGDINNLFVSRINKAFGVYYTCDAKEALQAKARDIKNQVYDATKQFTSNVPAVIHIGMETFDGPMVQRARFEKIIKTMEMVDPYTSNLRWVFCHFFQSYSTINETWVIDETVSRFTAYVIPRPPILKAHLIIPDDVVILDEVSHWDRPLPE
jgi:hypothetical protein